MKRIAAIPVVLLLLAAFCAVPGKRAFAQTLQGYSCTGGGFSLTRQGNGYFFAGPLYVPRPGYGYAFSPVFFSANGARAVLNVIPPRGGLDLPLPPLTVVPPLWVGYSFFSDVPVHSLTVLLDGPYTIGGERKIVCLVTGATR